MTLLFADGFERYASAANQDMGPHMAYVWATGGGTSRAGRIAGLATNFGAYWDKSGQGPTGITLGTTKFSAISAGVLGVGIKVDSFTNAGVAEYIQLKSGSTVVLTVGINTSGYFQLRNGATDLGTWNSPIAINTWYYVELKFTLGGSGTGVLEMRVEGFPGIVLPSVTTHASVFTMNNLSLNSSDRNSVQYDDLYICSQSGTYNNDFLGNFRSERIAPTGAGSVTQWTPNTGTNFGAVDEVPQSGATDYVSESTAGETDLYAFADPTIAGNIVGIRQSFVARKVTGDTNLTSALKIGGTTYEGDLATVTDAVNWKLFQQIREREPAASAAWDLTNLSAAEFGVRKK